MGKPTGFMDYKRQELALRPLQERIKDWEEIKTSSLPHKEELQKTGCALHGLRYSLLPQRRNVGQSLIRLSAA